MALVEMGGSWRLWWYWRTGWPSGAHSRCRRETELDNVIAEKKSTCDGSRLTLGGIQCDGRLPASPKKTVLVVAWLALAVGTGAFLGSVAGAAFRASGNSDLFIGAILVGSS